MHPPRPARAFVVLLLATALLTSPMIPLGASMASPADGRGAPVSTPQAFTDVSTNHPPVTLTGQSTSTGHSTPVGPKTYLIELRALTDDEAWTGYAASTPADWTGNRPPIVTVTGPMAGPYTPNGDMLTVAWDALDPDGDELIFTVEVLRNGTALASADDLPNATREVSFNVTTLAIPMGVNLTVLVHLTISS